MTPESIPGRLIPDDAELLWLEPYDEGPAHEHHEVMLTDLLRAA